MIKLWIVYILPQVSNENFRFRSIIPDCIQHELTSSDHSGRFTVLPRWTLRIYWIYVCCGLRCVQKVYKAREHKLRMHANSKTVCFVTMTNSLNKTNETKMKEMETAKNAILLSNSLALAAFYSSFFSLVATTTTAVAIPFLSLFVVFISSRRVGFCFSLFLYFVFVNIKYLGKIKWKMRHC